jgi:ComF family protein
LIRNFKFHQQLHLSVPLARLLIARLGQLDNLPDLILPVPLHPDRLKERGFNQTLEIGRIVSKHYAIPLDWGRVKRIRATRAQSHLSEQERRRNLRHAFRVYQSVRGLKLVILDDVITTGSTLAELSKVLKKAGAKQIESWAIARTNLC